MPSFEEDAMRPTTSFTLHALAAITLTAFAASSAAAANFLKIGDVKTRSAAGSANAEQIEILSWSWGETQTAGRVRKVDSLTTKREVAAGDVNADSPSDTIAAPRDSASGMPTGKRQHGWVTISKPLDRGSVTVKGSMSGCTVGAAYPDAVLQTAAARYEFKEVFITSCAMPGMSGSSGGGVPTESISFNYDRIQIVYAPQSKDKSKVNVKGWDPEKKQE
jgi:type VI protein secretion system component Hcp